jgi:hypothetical protein
MENVIAPVVESVSVRHTSVGMVGREKLGAVGVAVVVKASKVAVGLAILMW